jgi:hypothetical protein
MSAGRTFGTIGTFRAPPRAVQSDIAAVELPEGPGLAYKMRFLLGHRSNQIDSDDLKLTGRQPTATASLAKSGTVGAYFYGVRSCGDGRRPRGLSADAELRLSLTARGTRTAAGRFEKPRVVRGRDPGLRQGHATVRMRPGTTRIAAALPIRGSWWSQWPSDAGCYVRTFVTVFAPIPARFTASYEKNVRPGELFS